MSDFLSPILEWINAHPDLSGLAVFLISAAESIAIIGTIVPGTVMMTAIGTLAGAGVLPLWSTIFWAMLGAVVGDSVSYWIGYYFKDRLHYIWPFRTHPNLLATGERFVHKHGGKSVFIGRFVGPVRALVPLVAGMLGMQPLRFTIANVLSAIGWAPAYMLPGIALGAASLELPPDIAVHAILMLLLVGLFIILCLWIIRKLFLLISSKINQGLTRFWNNLQTSRFFFPIASALKHYNPKKTYGQLSLLFYFVIVSCLFLYLATYVYFHGPQNISINNFFFHFFRSLRTPDTDIIMLYITTLGEAKVLLPIMAILFSWFAWTKHWRTAWHVFALAAITIICIAFFKNLLHTPRPWGIVESPSGGSFPSGHATYSIVFFCGLGLLLTKACKQHFRRFFYSLAGIISIAICVSRLYLGAHWFTDILGGVLLGSAILMLVVLSYNRQSEKQINPFGLFSTICIAVLLCYSIYFSLNYQKLKHNYAQVDWPIHTITLNSWWLQKGDHLPRYRINRFGFAQQLLNLQWIGKLTDINDFLLKNGWETPPKTDWITVLHRVSDVQSAEHLPIVSPLYLDKKPVLVLTKHTYKKLIVLRLWKPDVIIKTSNQNLWVGTVEIVPRTYSWLFKPNRSNNVNLSAAVLFKIFPKDDNIKEMKINNTRRRHGERQSMVLIKPKKLL